MTTNIEIIGDALREINVVAETETPSAEQGQHALRVMNRMINSWRESDVSFSYFDQTSTSDTFPGPSWAEQGVVAVLAIRLAPTYGASISPELGDKADDGYTMILRKSINEKLDNTDMSHLPVGQGHNGYGRYDIDSDT